MSRQEKVEGRGQWSAWTRIALSKYLKIQLESGDGEFGTVVWKRQRQQQEKRERDEKRQDGRLEERWLRLRSPSFHFGRTPAAAATNDAQEEGEEADAAAKKILLLLLLDRRQRQQ